VRIAAALETASVVEKYTEINILDLTFQVIS
jgi:hypothetical protein